MLAKQVLPNGYMTQFDVDQMLEHFSALGIRLNLCQNAVQKRGVTLVLPMLLEGIEIRSKGVGGGCQGG